MRTTRYELTKNDWTEIFDANMVLSTRLTIQRKTTSPVLLYVGTLEPPIGGISKLWLPAIDTDAFITMAGVTENHEIGPQDVVWARAQEEDCAIVVIG